ncbi:MAG: glycosyl transferase [Planctomycetota bacterium]
MHICHVITRLIVGGAQENTLLTCEGLHARGHEVTLISGPTTGPEGALTARARAGGYRFIEIPALVRQVSPILDWRALAALRAAYRELRPDVVHTHSSKAGILGRLAAGRPAAAQQRVPAVVHTIHGMSFNRTQPWAVRAAYSWLERLAARRSDAIVTVADAMIEQTVAAGVCGREKLQTIYSGMEVEQFGPARFDRRAVRREWGIEDDETVVVGSVARLFRRKGYEQLIPIMARAAARDSRLRFVWVGDGAQRAEYETQLAQLGLRDRTTLVGLVRPDEIPRLLAGFDILAHASQWEGLPRAVVQGLLMCVPAVAFAIDGTTEVVLDGCTGRLIPLNDIERFADAVCALAGDRTARARMGEAGRAHCLERFDWRRMVDQLETLYLRLIPDR